MICRIQKKRKEFDAKRPPSGRTCESATRSSSAISYSISRLAPRGAIAISDLASEPFIMSLGGCEDAIQSMSRVDGCVPQVAFKVDGGPHWDEWIGSACNRGRIGADKRGGMGTARSWTSKARSVSMSEALTPFRPVKHIADGRRADGGRYCRALGGGPLPF